MDLSLRGRVYVISGGSRGLGLATARVLVDEGARVVLVGRSRTHLDAAVDSLGPGAAGLAADLTDPSTAAEAVEVAVERFGQVDGGLISVGGPPAGTVLTTTDEQWRGAFESVFLGSLRLVRTRCAGITESGGASTSNGLRPGLAMLITDLADEVGATGIRVNGLLPGRIATDRLAALDASTGDAVAARERASARIPLRRYGDPAEFGRTAAFVLSPAASYLTGSLVRVDGGATRHP
jgi:3-oxoacyl-[acyl-carrier protein] reductase